MPATGLEPVRCYSLEPESSASANSATRAQREFRASLRTRDRHRSASTLKPQLIRASESRDISSKRSVGGILMLTTPQPSNWLPRRRCKACIEPWLVGFDDWDRNQIILSFLASSILTHKFPGSVPHIFSLATGRNRTSPFHSPLQVCSPPRTGRPLQV